MYYSNPIYIQLTYSSDSVVLFDICSSGGDCYPVITPYLSLWWEVPHWHHAISVPLVGSATLSSRHICPSGDECHTGIPPYLSLWWGVPHWHPAISVPLVGSATPASRHICPSGGECHTGITPSCLSRLVQELTKQLVTRGTRVAAHNPDWPGFISEMFTRFPSFICWGRHSWRILRGQGGYRDITAPHATSSEAYRRKPPHLPLKNTNRREAAPAAPSLFAIISSE